MCNRNTSQLWFFLCVGLFSGRIGHADDQVPSYETVVKAKPYQALGTSQQEINREDIERTGAQNAAQILEQSAAIHMRSNARGERVLSLRGFTQRQSAVLLNGVPFYLPYNGIANLSYLPAEIIEQVIVARSPGHVMIGPNGLAGTVNIVLRKAGQGPRLMNSASVNYDRAWHLQTFHANNVSRFAYTLLGGLTETPGFSLSQKYQPTQNENGGRRNNSDHANRYLLGQMQWQTAGHEFASSVLFIDAKRGVPPSTVERPPRYWRFSVWRSLAISFRHFYQLGRLQIQETLFGQGFSNRLDAYDDEKYRTQDTARAFQTWYKDRVGGLKIESSLRLGHGLGGVHMARSELHLSYDHHQATSNSKSLTRFLFSIAPEFKSIFYAKWESVWTCQIMGEIPMHFPNEAKNYPWALGPMWSIHYQTTKNWSLGIALAQRHRFPTLKERFSSARGFRVPNADLQTESAWHLNLETHYKWSRQTDIHFSLFGAKAQHLIEQVPISEGYEQIRNTGQARLMGAEFSIQGQWWHLLIGINAMYLYARKVDQQPAWLAYRPQYKSSLFVDWQIVPSLTLGQRVQWIGAQRFLHPITRQWQILTSYWLWDAYFLYSLTDRAEMGLRVTNLLDMNVQTVYGFPDPGRQILFFFKLLSGPS